MLCRRQSRNAASASTSACSSCSGVNCSKAARTASVAGLIDSIAPPRAVIVGVPIACLLGFHQVYTGIHARRSYELASRWSIPSLFSYKERASLSSRAKRGIPRYARVPRASLGMTTALALVRNEGLGGVDPVAGGVRMLAE